MRACPVLVDIVAIDQIQPVCVSAHRGILVDSEPAHTDDLIESQLLVMVVCEACLSIR